MKKTLDFNSVQRPTLELTMKDDAHTVIPVCTPREELIEKLSARLPEIQEMMSKGDNEAIKAAFDLAAELISCNRDNFAVTGEDLRQKYGMNLEDAILFFSAYLDFVGEIQAAKN